MQRKVAKTLDERCSAKRRGRRCKFVAGHYPAYKHEDELGKRWPESKAERELLKP